MAQFMKGNSRTVRKMVTGYISGLIKPIIKGSGKIIYLMEKVNSNGMMVASTSVNGRTISCMVMENCFTKMAAVIKDNLNST